ncbi:MAG: hypothetical protein ACI9FN_000483 [Saprospiraceae bacterium]|jgi:hypothetical protein
MPLFFFPIFKILKRNLLLLFLFINHLLLSAQIDDISHTFFSINKEGHEISIPYSSNFDIDEDLAQIEKCIIVVHGTNRNSIDYYDNMISALSQRPELTEKTLVISPQFLTEEDVDAFSIADNFPYWSSDGWKVGANSKNNASNPRDFRISSYELLDSLIDHLARQFSNLNTLVFTGHSAGGQLTNRYTASSPIFKSLCSDHNISSKSIIANPGSYVYMSPLRRVSGTVDQFETPSGCAEYNEYSYGLEDLYAYHSMAGANQIKEWYGSREVVYMNGSNDNDPNASTLPRSCRAMLLGNHRLERGEIYYNHILDTYGADIAPLHRRYIIEGVGHNNFDMYHSEQGLSELFDIAPMNNCSDINTATADIPSIDVSLYPNPTTHSVILRMDENLRAPILVRMTSMSGVELWRQSSILSSEVLIPMEEWPVGMYLLHIKYSVGSVLYKIIKQ